MKIKMIITPLNGGKGTVTRFLTEEEYVSLMKKFGGSTRIYPHTFAIGIGGVLNIQITIAQAK